MHAHSVVLFLSAVTIAEIEDGIVKLRREGATRKATEMAAWMETLVHLYDDRILAFDTPTARIAGALSDRARAGPSAGICRYNNRGHRAAPRADNSANILS